AAGSRLSTAPSPCPGHEAAMRVDIGKRRLVARAGRPVHDVEHVADDAALSAYGGGEFEADPGEPASLRRALPGLLDRVANCLARFARRVLVEYGMVDDGRACRQIASQLFRYPFGGIRLVGFHAGGARKIHCSVQTIHTLRLVGPDVGTQAKAVVRTGGVERVLVARDARRDGDVAPGRRRTVDA